MILEACSTRSLLIGAAEVERAASSARRKVVSKEMISAEPMI